ncbi:MAG: BMP family ABC transporter substrate-binding protein [Clostridiales bacterium]|nr:BMP family ABC transporter substrate-binding protein [Candidatus Crickella caballi]
MNKKLMVLMLSLAMVFCFAFTGCGQKDAAEGDGTYEIAMVTDVGQLMDGSFNQYTFEGVKQYAEENGLTYQYYQPANGAEATDDDRIDAMNAAIEGGAKVIVTPGFLQETALNAVVPENPDVQFVFIDGWDMGYDNLVGVSYQEEQAGYLAGYATVMEGFTKLGFSGGGGGSNPACCRYGYGFAQGVNDAAGEKGIKVDLNYSWLHGSTFTGNDDLKTMLSGWFNDGMEACFMCGGTMFDSGVAAASEANGKIIGVDVDQSTGYEDIVITSATKGLTASVKTALTKFYADGTYGGSLVLGAADDAVGIPTDTWSLQNWTVDDYNALFEEVKAGKVKIDNASDVSDPTGKLANVNVNFIGE